MLKMEVIGNLGADAEMQNTNGHNYVSFRVAHTDKYTDLAGSEHSNTTWVQCFISGDGGKMLKYLRKGTKVFCRGNIQLRTFSSEKLRQIVAGVSMSVSEIELCGGSQRREVYDDDGTIYTVDDAGKIKVKTE